VYGTTSVDAVVTSLNTVVQDAMAIPHDSNSQAEFKHWYSTSLMFYIRRKNYFYRQKLFTVS
jgi:hypothetical protein